MNDDKSVQASMWLMVFLQTISSVDMPGKGPRKMPSPRSYVAILVAWGVLLVAVDAGYGRAAKAMAWTMVLAGLVLGPFGATATRFLNGAAGLFSSPAPAAPQPSSPGPAGG